MSSPITAWQPLPRKYALGTVVIQTFQTNEGGTATRVGTIRGHCNEMDKKGVATGQTLNFVVWYFVSNPEEPSYETSLLLSDEEVDTCHPRAGPWPLQENLEDIVYAIGARVHKQFGSKFYEGRVQAYRPSPEGTYYWIVYEDGDSEELDVDGIDEWREIARQQRSERATAKKPAAQKSKSRRPSKKKSTQKVATKAKQIKTIKKGQSRQRASSARSYTLTKPSDHPVILPASSLKREEPASDVNGIVPDVTTSNDMGETNHAV